MALPAAVIRETLAAARDRARKGALTGVGDHMAISRERRGEIITANLADNNACVDASIARGLADLRRRYHEFWFFRRAVRPGGLQPDLRVCAAIRFGRAILMIVRMSGGIGGGGATGKKSRITAVCGEVAIQIVACLLIVD